MKTLFLITARGGSKGIPHKNIKKLNGIPLIHYSIDLARHFVSDTDICVSTDDKKIIAAVKKRRLNVPFVRPGSLATDTSGSYEVILHAIDWYREKGINYERVILLQPTSPFRLKKDVQSAIAAYTSNIDMVASVKKTDKNPYSVLYQSLEGGGIKKLFSKRSGGERRQDSKDIFELNGAVYVFNAKSLRRKKISEFRRIKMTEMDPVNSVDIDNPIDWKWCEFLLEKK